MKIQGCHYTTDVVAFLCFVAIAGVTVKGQKRTHSLRALHGNRGKRNTLSACIGTYPTYEPVNGVDPTGSRVWVRFNNDDTFTMTWDLQGLDSACSDGCGIHIHEGTTCSDHDIIADHYWTPASEEDPWNAVLYTAESDGTSYGRIRNFDNGYNFAQNRRHAVVIHTTGGSRIGCGMLRRNNKSSKCSGKRGKMNNKKGKRKPTKKSKGKRSKKRRRTLSTCIGTYPTYEPTNDVDPMGSVVVRFNSDDNFDMSWDLQGLDPACSAGCGIHIHEGTTCSDHDIIADHYWTPADEEDPWNYVFYASDLDGTSRGEIENFSNGYSFAENRKHALVVHTFGGSRIGCGVLTRRTSRCSRNNKDGKGKGSKKGGKKKSKRGSSSMNGRVLSARIGTYPTYEANDGIDPAGSVVVDFHGDGTFDMTWDLNGLDPACSAGCGIHIHEGQTCSDHDIIADHYWTPLDEEDPWNYVFYYAESDGSSHGGIEDFENGYSFKENRRHAVVIHTIGGSRIGCGVLRVH